ncbi:MAG: A/G-specific adenine glycosylase [Chloroflexota bacterium]
MPAPLGSEAVHDMRRALLGWYAVEHRDFPWRGTRDPYAVLVSEVMLQQTQAARVAQRFPSFMARFPTVESLASGPVATVVAEWSGLGYNRRAIALHRAATIISREGWPRDVASLARLPGIGPYTARAVASLAFDTPVGVVDTNVRRWLLRRFGGPDRPRRLQSLSDTLAASGTGPDVAAWTHASMEFGAAICRPRDARCDICPIAAGCPSRDAAATVAVPRQAALRGTDRAYRGAVVRLLSAAAGHRITERRLRRVLALDTGRIGRRLDSADWERIIDGLERDGLAHRSGGIVRLGAATI